MAQQKWPKRPPPLKLPLRTNGKNGAPFENYSPSYHGDPSAFPPTQINDFIFLGNHTNAKDLTWLQDNQIGWILNVSSIIPNSFPDQFNYLRISILDKDGQNLLSYLGHTFDFIEQARTSGKNILIHCHMGISRSVSVTVAYLMRKNKLSLTQAYKIVKDKRSIVSPNLDFMGSLEQYHQELNGSNFKSVQ